MVRGAGECHVDLVHSAPSHWCGLSLQGTLWKGQAFCLKYNKVLFHQRSKFQDVLILDTETYGRVLVLDGVIQVTQRDQFSYAEMITHLPMFAHPDPEHVVLIGGGDGAVLTEIVKHRSVKTVTICEIDEMVIEVSKKFFPEYAAVWTHPKLTVHIGDGAAFLDSHKKKFDIVIVDSSVRCLSRFCFCLRC